MPIFAKLYPKAHEEENPMKKQGPKTHQENRKARKVQRNKWKWKQSTAKHKSAVEYKSATEYRSAA